MRDRAPSESGDVSLADVQPSGSQLRALIDAAPDAMFVWSGDRMCLVNAAMSTLFGRPHHEFYRSTFELSLLLHADNGEKQHQVLQLLARPPESPCQLTFVGVRGDGTRAHIEAALTAVEWEGERAVLGCLRDVGARLQREANAEERRRIESIGRLAGGLAHDLNDLLANILMTAEMADPEDEAGAVREDLASIMASVEAATEVVRELLVFSQLQPAIPVHFNLNDQLQALAPRLESMLGSDVTFDLDCDPELGDVSADPALLRRVVVNLVTNAREAMPRGGRLRLSTRNAHDSAEDAAEGANGGARERIELEIADSGEGIPESLLPHVFEPFVSTKSGGRGAGLGLASVHGIVAQSGGRIGVRSQRGGTVMTVSLPRATYASSRRSVEPRVPQGSAVPRSVLVIEDHGALRGITERALVQAGCRVETASSQLEALQLYCARDANHDLIVADVMLPGITGPALVGSMAQIRPLPALIFMSGYPRDTLVNMGLVPAGSTFLQKPFHAKELLAAVAAVMTP